MQKESTKQLEFSNEVINKRKLQNLMSQTFHNYGILKSALIADKVKNLTFHYATRSGISLSVEDLRIPFKKRDVIGITSNEVDITEQNYRSGNITVVERFQKVIDIWNNANNTLKDEVLTYFRESDPLNPLYIMAFSGARGNISQVRQLVGMRGLMADPQGQIIDLPIKSNFREGLKVTEYIISSYGARKGLVDTALRTADSGYLTRRLVDVAQDIIVREEDCLTQEALSLHDLFEKNKTDLSLKDRIGGRLLAKAVHISPTEVIPADTEITDAVIEKLRGLNFKEVEVRSPLTCNSLRSVCRKCYGWHLSYSRIVDLGEAVGILAAQSIGEPGTQLTMRTFHTGGVFSGDLTKQIRAPFPGTVHYQLSKAPNLVRTIHGERGFKLLEKVDLVLEDTCGTLCRLEIPSDTILLVNAGTTVYRNQIIAEIKKDANLILEEDQRDIYTEVAGEVFLQNIQLEEAAEGEDKTKKISKNSGLLWVLFGTPYSLQGSAKLALNVGQKISANDTLVSKKIINNYGGIINLDAFSELGEIRVMNSSMILKNAVVIKNGTKNDSLQLFSSKQQKTFHFCVQEGEFLKHGQTVAFLKEDAYRTQTGGVIHYALDYFGGKKRRNTKKIFTGSLYWIPEETHQLNTVGLENVKVTNGSFVTAGTDILPNVNCKLNGLVQIDEFNRELTIKPGELFLLNELKEKVSNKAKRFVQPGEVLFASVFVQKLSFVEFINIQGSEYLFLRPVQTFKVPQEKGFLLEHLFFPNERTRNVTLRTIKRIFYKDGERVKSCTGVNLLKTFLVLDMHNNKAGTLQPRIEYLSDQSSGHRSKLKIGLYENIKADETLRASNPTNKSLLKLLVKNQQYVFPNTTLANLEMISQFSGTLGAVNKTNGTEILLLKESDIKKCFYNPEKQQLLVKKGDLVRAGTYLTPTVRSKYAGQIYNVTPGQIEIRLGRPYLISAGTILRVDSKSLVQRSDLLATLVYDKLKTVDIVQGLPKVEEILEARKIKNGCLLAPHEGKAYLRNTKIEIVKPLGGRLVIDVEPNTKVNFTSGEDVQFLQQLTDGPISPHEKLETLFAYYASKFSTGEACKKSFKQLQLFLVNEVQRTYLSQGVQIADKHIEIIVKQMTSKVRISAGGDTTLLPGELLEINQADTVARAALAAGEEPPTYKPVLLGLTKASLNSDSFISAASFQETTRVLTEAAIEGKKDWLNGLKENVIIGRLIPAGTGFNCVENFKKTQKETSMTQLNRTNQSESLLSNVLKARLKNEY
jgi:DNA-directed RNA polymerase subunit beta'|tara:strand:+ start:13649 stop:17431 length:3783 start_codon:yes stop_codon:yes gene_type:complete